MRYPRHDPTRFARRLRAAGLSVPVDRVISFTAALGVLTGPERELDPRDLYWAGRCTLLRSPDERSLYDSVFAEVFLGCPPEPPPASRQASVEVGYDTSAGAPDRADPDPGAATETRDRQVRWSRIETLRDRDFAEATEDEQRELWAAVARLRVEDASVRTGRLRPSTVGALDLRRTARLALARSGEVIELRHHDRGSRPRRIVLLVDVSGSMEPYARALLRFAHAVSVGRQRVEVFAVGTRLTRLTRHLAGRDPDSAIRAASGAVLDWSGGTRLGDALRSFIDEWGQRGVARGARVVILSDGWDRGDPEVLTEQMARLSRLAHRVMWVNPLRATSGYEPLARGMAAALPYCDDFVDGHSLSSLVDLAALVSRDGDRARRSTRPSTADGAQR